MKPKYKSALVAIIFFLIIVLPITVVIVKEKFFSPKEVHIISVEKKR